MTLHHSNPTAGHLGIHKPYDIIARKYWFPRMRNRIKHFVQTCNNCQRNKMERTPIRGLLEPLQIPSQKWQSISIDWISGLPTSANENDCILTIVERLTHMVHLIPCRTTLTSSQLAHLLIQHVVRLHGVPRSIHSDRDPKLVARFWKELCRQLGIVHKYTTAYHPSSNGLVERMNRSVEQVLRTLLDNSPLEKWEEKLPLVEMAINNSNLFHCEYSPFYLNYGFHPCLVHDVAERNRPSQNKDVDAFVSRMDKDLDRYTGILLEAQRNMKIHADRLRKSVEFKIGDMVLFKQSRLTASISSSTATPHNRQAIRSQSVGSRKSRSTTSSRIGSSAGAPTTPTSEALHTSAEQHLKDVLDSYEGLPMIPMLKTRNSGLLSHLLTFLNPQLRMTLYPPLTHVLAVQEYCY